MTEINFHHLGIACVELDREQRVWASMGYTPEGPDFSDPIQRVNGRFLGGPGPRLELLVAHPGSNVLDPWLVGGSRPYHQAFEVPDLAISLGEFAQQGARTVVEPVPAVAFDGRLIAFVIARNLALIELIELPRL